jgi:hypothetical protein
VWQNAHGSGVVVVLRSCLEPTTVAPYAAIAIVSKSKNMENKITVFPLTTIASLLHNPDYWNKQKSFPLTTGEGKGRGRVKTSKIRQKYYFSLPLPLPLPIFTAGFYSHGGGNLAEIIFYGRLCTTYSLYLIFSGTFPWLHHEGHGMSRIRPCRYTVSHLSIQQRSQEGG